MSKKIQKRNPQPQPIEVYVFSREEIEELMLTPEEIEELMLTPEEIEQIEREAMELFKEIESGGII